MTRIDTTPAGTFASTYANDANDNLAQLTYPSGRVVTYHYDGENRLTGIRPSAAGRVVEHAVRAVVRYGDDGRLDQLRDRRRHASFQLRGEPAEAVVDDGGTDVLDLTYSYDNAGNVTSITDPRPNATQTFVPDPLDRLLAANGPWGTLQWSYDAAGNRLSETAPGRLPITPTTHRRSA